MVKNSRGRRRSRSRDRRSRSIDGGGSRGRRHSRSRDRRSRSRDRHSRRRRDRSRSKTRSRSRSRSRSRQRNRTKKQERSRSRSREPLKLAKRSIPLTDNSTQRTTEEEDDYFPPHATVWQCATCKFSNDAGMSFCKLCKFPRGRTTVDINAEIPKTARQRQQQATFLNSQSQKDRSTPGHSKKEKRGFHKEKNYLGGGSQVLGTGGGRLKNW
mmetsp:Transcript_44594/g.87349  ORF Transcript_44594/g.87349 Transcript_44594/m.87349 type:complete len:213 (+) Transcript_44594:31-669(+)